jgi:DNA-binding transcriptional ArsR family regulator
LTIRRVTRADLPTFLLEAAQVPSRTLASRAAARFGISRQAVHAHLARLQRAGAIEASGRTRARTYRLATLADLQVEVALSAGFDEDAAWIDRTSPALDGVAPNVVEIARFGLTECLRNAADHSGADRARVRVRRNAVALELSVADRGTGIFARLDATDPGRAALDLVKGGRSTAAPDRPGRGFASVARAFDGFSVWSGHHRLHRESRGGGAAWELETLVGRVPGTTIVMGIAVRSRRTLAESLARSIDDRGGVRAAARRGPRPPRAARRRRADDARGRSAAPRAPRGRRRDRPRLRGRSGGRTGVRGRGLPRVPPRAPGGAAAADRRERRCRARAAPRGTLRRRGVGSRRR